MITDTGCTLRLIQKTELLHTTLGPTTNTVIAQTFLAEIDKNTMFPRQCFSLIVHTSYKLRVTEEDSNSDMKKWKSEWR